MYQFLRNVHSIFYHATCLVWELFRTCWWYVQRWRMSWLSCVGWHESVCLNLLNVKSRFWLSQFKLCALLRCVNIWLDDEFSWQLLFYSIGWNFLQSCNFLYRTFSYLLTAHRSSLLRMEIIGNGVALVWCSFLKTKQSNTISVLCSLYNWLC